MCACVYQRYLSLEHINLDEEERVHKSSKSIRGSPSREKAQPENDDDADKDNDDNDGDDDDDRTGKQCTETHALLVTGAHTSDDLTYSSTPSSPSSSPTSLSKQRHQPRSSGKKNETSSRKSSIEAIQEAAAFLCTEGDGEVRRRKRRPRARQRKVIGDLKYFYEREALCKNLTDGMVLSTNDTCDRCASRADSPVYSDRVVYDQQPLMAREVTLLQTVRGHTVFIPTSKLADDVDFMPVYKLAKSNASGIFYSTGFSSDAVDLKASLEPSIVLLDSPHSSHSVESDTPFYRQSLDKGYSRISEKGTIEQRIGPFMDRDFRIDMESKVEEKTWMAEAARKDQIEDLERNRSSLLMLEPLLLMSSETANRGVKYEKKRLAHSEHLKLVRIVIAYSLTFVILVSITYYVVYFT